MDAALLRQIDELGKQLDGWRAAHAQATKDASAHAGDQNAERYGIRLHGGHTGQEGPGRRWNYYKDESQRRNAEAAALVTQIDAGTKRLAELRREAAEVTVQNEAARSARLAVIEREHGDLVRRADAARAARGTLQDSRAEWIDRHVRADADYVPVSAALSDRLRVLLPLALRQDEIRIRMHLACEGSRVLGRDAMRGIGPGCDLRVERADWSVLTMKEEIA